MAHDIGFDKIPNTDAGVSVWIMWFGNPYHPDRSRFPSMFAIKCARRLKEYYGISAAAKKCGFDHGEPTFNVVVKFTDEADEAEFLCKSSLITWEDVGCGRE
jgi:hypothetical protein